MQQIVPPIRIIQKILGEQKRYDGTLYRLSTHCMRVEQPDGVLLYHTLTGELLLLATEEAAGLGTLPGPAPLGLEKLAVRWFLVPYGTDDMALANQTRQIAECFVEKGIALTGYTIFTTTSCNARCFYCFEAGWGKNTMSPQTARDTAAYIAAHCGGKPVQLGWFGGEPLVNVKAIDVVTDFLRQQGVEFCSTMTSNGYLFDKTLAMRAKNDWKLDEVQITLDGTEEVYNRRKAYVNPEGSPFQRVLRNIGLLLDTGIHVKVRLNMDEENEQDLYELVDQLSERFAGKPGFGVCLMALMEDVGANPPSYTEEQRNSYAEKLRLLRAYIERKGIGVRESLKGRFAVNACLADNSRHTTVMPDGRLGRCDSCCDASVWGSIYSDTSDEEVIRQWKERKPPETACKTCAVYPQCVRLKKCQNWLEHCSPIERETREHWMRRAVLGTYEDWKAINQT